MPATYEGGGRPFRLLNSWRHPFFVEVFAYKQLPFTTRSGWGEGYSWLPKTFPPLGGIILGGVLYLCMVALFREPNRTDEDATGEQLAVMAEVCDAEGEEDDGGGPFGRHSS